MKRYAASTTPNAVLCCSKVPNPACFTVAKQNHQTISLLVRGSAYSRPFLSSNYLPTMNCTYVHTYLAMPFGAFISQREFVIELSRHWSSDIAKLHPASNDNSPLHNLTSPRGSVVDDGTKPLGNSLRYGIRVCVKHRDPNTSRGIVQYLPSVSRTCQPGNGTTCLHGHTDIQYAH